MLGTVKAWCGSYGFITPDAGRGDIFCYHADIQMTGFRELTPGDRVSFEVGKDDSGRRRAVAVELLEPAAEAEEVHRERP